MISHLQSMPFSASASTSLLCLFLLKRSSQDWSGVGGWVDGGERGGWMSYRGFGGAFLCVPYCHLQSSFLLAAVVRALEIYAFWIGLDYFT